MPLNKPNQTKRNTRLTCTLIFIRETFDRLTQVYGDLSWVWGFMWHNVFLDKFWETLENQPILQIITNMTKVRRTLSRSKQLLMMKMIGDELILNN